MSITWRELVEYVTTQSVAGTLDLDSPVPIGSPTGFTYARSIGLAGADTDTILGPGSHAIETAV